MASQSITLRLMQKTRPEQRLIFAREEYGDDINFTIHDKDGVAKNLTGITPAFQLGMKGYRPFIDKDATVTDAANGKCKYTLQQDDLAKTGTFHAKMVLRTGTKKEATETFLMVVQD